MVVSSVAIIVHLPVVVFSCFVVAYIPVVFSFGTMFGHLLYWSLLVVHLSVHLSSGAIIAHIPVVLSIWDIFAYLLVAVSSVP